MIARNLISLHIKQSIRIVTARTHGYDIDAERMQAQANLRLVIMNGEELRELARLMTLNAHDENRAEELYYDLIIVKERLIKSSYKWIHKLFFTLYYPITISKN